MLWPVCFFLNRCIHRRVMPWMDSLLVNYGELDAERPLLLLNTPLLFERSLDGTEVIWFFNIRNMRAKTSESRMMHHCIWIIDSDRQIRISPHQLNKVSKWNGETTRHQNRYCRGKSVIFQMGIQTRVIWDANTWPPVSLICIYWITWVNLISLLT